MAMSLDTAGKRDPRKFDTEVDLLSIAWDLGLKPLTHHLPIKLTRNEVIVKRLSYCFYKSVFEAAVAEFEFEASKLYEGWLKIPVSVRGDVPVKTRHRPKPISDQEREILLQLLKDIVDRYFEACPKTPQKPLQNSARPIRPVPFSPHRSLNTKIENVKGIQSNSSATAKRSGGSIMPDFAPTKRIRQPSGSPHKVPAMAPPQTIQQPRGLKQTKVQSFMSTSNFSADSFDSSKGSTQITIPDQIMPSKSYPSALISSQEDYWSSSLEAGLDEIDKKLLQGFDSVTTTSISSGIRPLSAEERLLQEQLQSIFPELPRCFYSLPFSVSYEVTRAFLHTEVSMSDLKRPPVSFKDYDAFWQYLKALPALEGKQLPQRSSEEAWAAAVDPSTRQSQKFEAVVFSASLSFHSGACDNPFKLRLMPLRLALPHRSGRQFGQDRFFELRVPSFEAAPCYKNDIYPDLLLRAGPAVGEKELLQRLCTLHVFCVRMLLGSNHKSHPNMTIGKFLNCVRPTDLNGEQCYLKLFSRTSLALSRNRPTVIVPKSQVRHRTKDILSGGEIMNDGAARLSRSLAEKIGRILMIDYQPATYQARFGGAKGLWVVDHVDDSNEDWVEVYPSQQKWKQDAQNDEDVHRTFEVLAYSARLKTHALNEQLILLLMNGARNKDSMENSIAAAMEISLDLKLEEMDLAIDNPQLLRRWLKSSNSNTKERSSGDGISYKVAMPVVIEERLNGMLDAGFNQKRLLLMKDFLTKLFTRTCDGLREKLSIPIARSAYPFMVPDFWGLLEPGEVCIAFSQFRDIDGVTDLTDSIRDGDHVLVARNPAHLPSDIQKVKAVRRDKFLPLKDVIIFSTKGNPSLASMLSGGDYDGDRAWVCWDPVIVDNFKSVSVPVLPDFFAQGLLKRETTTYNGLATTAKDRERAFLSKAITFNMRPNLLPFCTSYKESMAYTSRSVSSKEMIAISTLLSNLVDRPKQGIIFDYVDWTAFVDACITTQKHWLRDKKENLGHNVKNDIIDRLRLTAKEKIDVALAKLHKKFPDSIVCPNPAWDEDLVRRCNTARDRALKNPEWKTLMHDLTTDLTVVKSMWTAAFRRDGLEKASVLEDESKLDFVTLANEVFAVYQKIRPRADTPFTQALLPEPHENPGISKWELLKASTLFASYPRYKVSNCVWWMAYPQLCYIKAQCQQGQKLLLTAKMWAGLKPDKAITRQMEVVEFTEQELDDELFVNAEETGDCYYDA